MEQRFITQAVHDVTRTVREHTLGGSGAQRLIRKGKGAHVFNDDVDLRALEELVWRQGTFRGSVATGDPQRADFERLIWRSETAIGRRIQEGRADVLLHWVEIKGKINPVTGAWEYHLVPRARPAE